MQNIERTNNMYYISRKVFEMNVAGFAKNEHRNSAPQHHLASTGGISERQEHPIPAAATVDIVR